MTTTVAEMVAFLEARIAEDEAWARTREREAIRHHRVSAHRPHLAPDDPTRVLAECEAKRKQIVHLVGWMENDYAPQNETQLLMMVEVYASHPDFRGEWRS